GAVAQLLDRQPREHRFGEALGRLRLAGVFVGLLQQQPVAVLATHARQRPPPAQPEAEQLELELAALDLLARRLGRPELAPAGVAHARRTGPLVPPWTDAPERGPPVGLVLDARGQP